MIKRLGHVGNLIGIIVLLSIGIDLVASLWLKSDIFRVGFLRASQAVAVICLIIGGVLLVLGSIVASVAHEAFKRAVTQDEQVVYIVKDGAFRLVRHPFYLSLIMICFSLVLLFRSYLVLAASILVAIILVSQAREEERFLTAKFGEEYLAYQKTTGMFFPKILGK